MVTNVSQKAWTVYPSHFSRLKCQVFNDWWPHRNAKQLFCVGSYAQANCVQEDDRRIDKSSSSALRTQKAGAERDHPGNRSVQPIVWAGRPS